MSNRSDVSSIALKQHRVISKDAGQLTPSLVDEIKEEMLDEMCEDMIDTAETIGLIKWHIDADTRTVYAVLKLVIEEA